MVTLLKLCARHQQCVNCSTTEHTAKQCTASTLKCAYCSGEFGLILVYVRVSTITAL